MTKQRTRNERFAIALGVAVTLHALVLLIPPRTLELVSPTSRPANTLRVLFQPRSSPEPTAEATRTPVAVPDEIAPPEPVEERVAQPDPESLPERVVSRPEPEIVRQESEMAAPAKSATQLLSSQFDYKRPTSVFGAKESDTPPREDFVFRSRPSLDDVLNEPSVQLPFRDQRIYLVDSYSPGLSGSVEKFFDAVTVPFGWKTKNNTRIQCAWVLIITACSWGHASLFEKTAKRRKVDPDEYDSDL